MFHRLITAVAAALLGVMVSGHRAGPLVIALLVAVVVWLIVDDRAMEDGETDAADESRDT